jgi:hypothetical protein
MTDIGPQSGRPAPSGQSIDLGCINELRGVSPPPVLPVPTIRGGQGKRETSLLADHGNGLTVRLPHRKAQPPVPVGTRPRIQHRGTAHLPNMSKHNQLGA